MKSFIRRARIAAAASLAAGVFVLASPAFGQSAKAGPPVAGRDYIDVKPAQSPETAGKIEVLEFFSYACPHCKNFDPSLSAWAKAAQKDVELRRVPITFGREQWLPLARMYYTLEALGELPRLHAKVFHAIHEENFDLAAENLQFEWMSKQGLDRRKYTETYKSFSVQSKVARAQQLAAAYKVQGVPALAVDGKYLTNGSLSGSHDRMLAITDQLIATVRKPAARK